uniref:Gpm110 n=1 Tax=Arundo donax TaxID=35708 RepID=A0A0A9HDP6_ARUDO
MRMSWLAPTETLRIRLLFGDIQQCRRLLH